MPRQRVAYIENVAPKMDMSSVKRTKGRDPKESHKQAAAEYYKRRGAFVAFRRRIEIKLGLDKKSLNHLGTTEELDDFCRQYVLEHSGERAPLNATAYVGYLYRPSRTPSEKS